jgi:hypothetical protein
MKEKKKKRRKKKKKKKKKKKRVTPCLWIVFTYLVSRRWRR